MPNRTSLNIKADDRSYLLTRISDQTYRELAQNSLHIATDYGFLFDLAYDESLIYSSMSRMYASLSEHFGPSGKMYDDYKGSFSFPFSLSFEHEGQSLTYLLRFFNARTSIEYQLMKVCRQREHGLDTRVLHEAFADFTDPQIYFVISFLAGFLSGYFESVERFYEQFFFQSVESNWIVFGFKDGKFFDTQYETEEEFRAAIADLRAYAAQQLPPGTAP